MIYNYTELYYTVNKLEAKPLTCILLCLVPVHTFLGFLLISILLPESNS